MLDEAAKIGDELGSGDFEKWDCRGMRSLRDQGGE
jgi:hypothetical protein